VGGMKTFEIGLGGRRIIKKEKFIEALHHHDDGHSNISDVKLESDSRIITLVSECDHHTNRRVCGETVSKIISLAENNGVGIETFSTKEPSLEEAFIEVLRRNGS
jgi:hypothetical protein